MIDVQNLDFDYPSGERALRGVTFHLRAGERAGLIGPNGAGKSTLLLLLDGLLRGAPGKGIIRIGGLTLSAETAAIIRQRIGLLFQDPNDQLFCPTVAEDVAFGPQQLPLTKDAVQQRVRAALEAAGIPHLEDSLPHHLSLGEKKRVCLAGILAYRPEILLLDEPTANFDPRARREFVELCRPLSATMLIASHDLDLVCDLCPRAILLDGGQIIADGPTLELLNRETLMLAHGLEKPRRMRG